MSWSRRTECRPPRHCKRSTIGELKQRGVTDGRRGLEECAQTQGGSRWEEGGVRLVKVRSDTGRGRW